MKVFIRFIALVSFLFITLSCTVPVAQIDTKISSFVFKQADNSSVLSVDVAGKIDSETKVISVLMPSTVAFANYSALVPTIELPEGVTLVNEKGARDFRVNPLTYTVTSSDGTVEVYAVKVTKGAVTAPATALVISEYYCGTGYGLSGDRNRWLELTNRTASAIDLSQYSLKQNVWINGTRTESRDTIAALSGTLPANVSYVIYSDRLNSRFTSVVAATNKTSDTTLNTIMDFDGDDGFQLIQNGVVVDVVGPDNGNGDGSVFAREKLLLRKNTMAPSITFTETEWVAYVLDKTNIDAANVGTKTLTIATSDTTLTYFAFENLPVRTYGLINSAGTIAIAVPEGTDLTKLNPSFSSKGAGIAINGEIKKSGTEAFNFSSPLVLTVIADNLTTVKDYVVTTYTYAPFKYSNINYAFTGGIKTVVNAILASGTANAQNSPSTLSANVEGILTCKEIYIKWALEGSTKVLYKYSYTIQDGESALLILSNDGIDLPIGSRIRIAVTKGQYYWGMPLISAYGSVTRVDPLIYNVYYKTGSYTASTDAGFMYMYSGTVALAPNDYYEGKFTTDLGYKTASALQSSILTGMTGTFYGPIVISYGNKMQITSPDQIK